MLLAKGILKYFPLEGEENNRGWLILQCDREWFRCLDDSRRGSQSVDIGEGG
jgi:hypothetical protein